MFNAADKKKLKRWSQEGRRVFAEVYELMLANPELLKHPAQANIPAAHWKTLCWNAAWTAADAVDGKL